MCNKYIPEKFLYGIWQKMPLEKIFLKTFAGVSLDIVFRGRRNCGAGPDFVDALIYFEDQGLKRGDIEIHSSSSDWYTHGHNLNPRYNSVILHVVCDTKISLIMTESGLSVPSLLIPKNIINTANNHEKDSQVYSEVYPKCSQVIEKRGLSFLKYSLELAGRERLLAKAASIDGDIEFFGKDETFYRRFMEILGYSANRQAMLSLAETIKWDFIKNILVSQPIEKRLLIGEALLFGSAGFLAKDQDFINTDCHNSKNNHLREDVHYINSLFQLWHNYDGLDSLESKNLWKINNVKPLNSPLRRISAAAHLFAVNCDYGLINSLYKIFNENPLQAIPQKLISFFIEPATDQQSYWTQRHNFKRKISKNYPSLIGRSRSLELIVNLVFPFTLSSGFEFADKSLIMDLYMDLPSMADNEITKYMKNIIGIGEKFPLKPFFHQGMHHIYQSFCRFQNCEDCFLTN